VGLVSPQSEIFEKAEGLMSDGCNSNNAKDIPRIDFPEDYLTPFHDIFP
jgi:hypothetical protein